MEGRAKRLTEGWTQAWTLPLPACVRVKTNYSSTGMEVWREWGRELGLVRS